MAIDQGTETLSVVSQERTWRIEVFTDKGAEPSVRVHRETVKVDPDGNVISRVQGIQVIRTFSQIADQSFTVGNDVYTGAEIASVLSAIADTWRRENIAAEAAAAATNA